MTSPLETPSSSASSAPPGELGGSRRGKAAGAFRTISEVATDLDVPQHVLRFWETRFAQIRPLKRAGGRRYYRPEDVDLLRRIRQLLYNNGYTIKGVQRLLRDVGRGSEGEDTPARSEPPAAAMPVVEPAPVAAPAPLRATPPAIPIAAKPGAPEAADRIAAAIQELLEIRDSLRKFRR